MTEPAEQTHHLGTPGSPSGGSRGDASEHLPANSHGLPQNGDRGRQREQNHRRRAESCGDISADKLWQTRGGQREVCPGNAAQPHKTPSGDSPGDRALRRAFSNQVPVQVQEEGLLVDSDTGLDARLGKKKHRRRTSKKKRSWKPYNKLSWEEKKALEERETARASRMREEMFAKGLPVAPYNTTQFLMDEHDREEPDLNTETGVRRSLGAGGRAEDTGSEEDLFDQEEDEEDDGSGGGSDGIGRPGNAGGEFLQRDFSETYEMYHVESLQNMTKQELVQEYLELEKCMSRLEEENNRLRRAAPEGSQVRIREMELELERLRAENTELLLQNRAQIPAT
ncbi:protein HEXIM1 [Kryptolebias marmoratus]|uniref:HEXIM P-TEFb complex subunit 1 n=1 Tax=Kryptolebias marmoratus TaxID=37003 RepID=A0A3Q3AT90_KRYMA|nr:protein HEXIM1 [Kryptolebias marmoratus]